MRNWQRWAITIASGFLGGLIQCASDSQPQAFMDYFRHGLIGLGPAVAALQLTLNQNEKAAADSSGVNGK